MVVAALFTGCTPEVVDETPEMVEVGDIAVTFSVDGEEVRSLDLSSVSHNIKVDVTLNNEGIYWNAVSNKDWCYIDNEVKHRGSDSFYIVINANDSFEARETATIKFVAGEYSEKMLTVDHNGNVFVLDQVYAASPKAAGSFTTKVKTFDAGEAWHFECDPWITATKGAVTTAEGETFTEVTIAWAENADASRYGEVKLVKDGKDYADGWINIWQFGTELNYDADGNILLAAQDVAPLEIRVPAQTVKEITMPSWVEYTIQENGDKTVSYMLQFAGNPSDANHIRTTELTLSFLSGAADIQLPVIKQEFYAMEGLLTGPGLALFAKTWNEGGDVSQWFINGVPTIIADVDLTEIKEWEPIGTAARPWTGEFNGNGKKLINFTSTKPLFGVCENATLKNIVFDETSTISVIGSYEGELCLAPLATEIKSTIIENCTNNAKVSLDASCATANNTVYVGGLVAKADATSVVKRSSNFGKINIPSSCTTAAGSTFNVGALVGHNAGIIEDGFNNGPIELGVQVSNAYVGGIVGWNERGAVVRNNQNAAAITYSSKRSGTESYGYVGGISGIGNGTISGNTNEGDITSKSNVHTLYVGGITTYVEDGNVQLTDNSQANASDLEIEGGNLNAYAGGLAAYVVDGVSLNFDFSKDTGKFEGTIKAGNGEANASANVIVGGLIGCTESALTVNNLHYNGTITANLTNVTKGTYYAYAGVVGWAKESVTITNSTTAGGIDVPKTTTIPNIQMCYGGFVGLAEMNTTITGCENSMNILFAANTPSKSNGYPSHMGGIAGRIKAGTVLIENCKNTGNFQNYHYNNNWYLDLKPVATAGAAGKPSSAGGILGSYGFHSSLDIIEDNITIKGCTSICKVQANRGIVAGIAGFVANATIEGCSFEGNMLATGTQYNPYAAGIVGVAIDSTIKNCSAKADMQSAPGGSCHIRQGGIAAWIFTSNVEGCEYYGNTTFVESAASSASSINDDFCGGIVGLVHDDTCVIKNCQFGGNLNGVAITANNYNNYVIGTATQGGWTVNPTIEGCSFWGGK